jgi:sialate O-acetylesterase
MNVVGRTIELTFEHVGGGLMAAKKSSPRSVDMPKPVDKLNGFAIAGANKKWHWADAVIKDDRVTVSSAEIENPVAVRYGFSMNPVRANLYNLEGLPAAPFRTDTWEFYRYRSADLREIVGPPSSAN